jgi:hypothetical protein
MDGFVIKYIYFPIGFKMTLSNFDWTDKDSVKWFLLLPTGHEGPYSLNKLIYLQDQKKIAGDLKIWAEGLGEAVLLKEALRLSVETNEEDEIPDLPDLPPLPEDEIPPLPLPEEELETRVNTPVVKKRVHYLPWWGFISLVLLLMIFFAFSSLIKNHETFSVRRLPKMKVELHERILKENSFEGWNKKIFFKEYLPDDHSHIWLVSAGFQQCAVEASFTSLPDKMLSLDEEKVAFKSQGQLSGHLVEFSSFDFSQGSKIIPGMYEMNVRASKCEWEGVIPKLMNRFQGPDKEYQASTKVVLFAKGPVEFSTVLERLLKKKQEDELRELNRNELFWQDLQQKLETLQAITLQIEQLLLDFLDKPATVFIRNRGPMIETYTRQFGSFLTTFVVENENYFKNLGTKGSSQKRNYELMVKLASKRIGLESMKFIEEFQGMKRNPTPKELALLSGRVKKVFAAIKSDIGRKIIQVSDDRSL